MLIRLHELAHLIFYNSEEGVLRRAECSGRDPAMGSPHHSDIWHTGILAIGHQELSIRQSVTCLESCSGHWMLSADFKKKRTRCRTNPAQLGRARIQFARGEIHDQS